MQPLDNCESSGSYNKKKKYQNEFLKVVVLESWGFWGSSDVPLISVSAL